MAQGRLTWDARHKSRLMPGEVQKLRSCLGGPSARCQSSPLMELKIPHTTKSADRSRRPTSADRSRRHGSEYKTQLSFEFLFIDTANVNGPIRDELAKIKAAV